MNARQKKKLYRKLHNRNPEKGMKLTNDLIRPKRPTMKDLIRQQETRNIVNLSRILTARRQRYARYKNTKLQKSRSE